MSLSWVHKSTWEFSNLKYLWNSPVPDTKKVRCPSVKAAVSVRSLKDDQPAAALLTQKFEAPARPRVLAPIITQLATDQKQRNNVAISLEKVVEENGDESEQKHPRAGENGNSMTIMTVEATVAEEVLVKIQQTNEPTWREAKESSEKLSEKIRTVPLKEEQEVLQDKAQNNGNSKGLPPWDVGHSGRTVLPKDPEFHQKG